MLSQRADRRSQHHRRWIVYIAHAQYSPIEEPGVAGDSVLRVVLVVVTGRRSFGDLRGKRRRNRRPG